jgi:thioredoxin-related protein
LNVKKLLFFLFVVALCFPFLASALTYDSALKTAKEKNKPVFLYFFSNSCGYCRLMDKETLADKEINSVLTNDFVFVRVDIEKSADLAMLYGIRGVPSSWFLEPSGKRISQQIPGYVSKRDFRVLLDYVRGKHYKQMDMVDYFEKASRNK